MKKIMMMLFVLFIYRLLSVSQIQAEERQKCYMTIKSDVHTENNPAYADGICYGDFQVGYYASGNFIIIGLLTYVIPANTTVV